jgi:hypothetical protein
MFSIHKQKMEKQWLVNQLLLPTDINNIIKSFCFYDIKTYNTICLIKSKKKEIHHQINKVIIFYRLIQEEHSQRGVVMQLLDHYIRQLYIKYFTCNRCGQYISNHPRVCSKIICRC